MSVKTFQIAPLGATISELPILPAELSEKLRSRFEASKDEGSFQFDPQYFRDPRPDVIEMESDIKKPKNANGNKTLACLKYQQKVKKILNSLPDEARADAVKELESALDAIQHKYQSGSS